MSVTRCAAIALIAVALAFPLRAGAQSTQPIALDLDVGPGTLLGGPEVLTRGSMVADGLLTMRLAKAGSSGLVAGMSVGWQGPPPSGDQCKRSQPAGPCLQNYPQFASYGALAGWTSAAGRVRVLGGVAAVSAQPEEQSAKPEYTVGFPVRLETVLLKFSHVAAVVSLRAIGVPQYRGDAYVLLASGLGFRIY